MPRKSGKQPKTAEPEGKITVTAQQSRYRVDAVDAPVDRNVIIKDLSISVGRKEILSHAELNFQEGRHYVLVGRNGTGKSTLLRAIADGLVPGIPWSLRVLLLGQTRATVKDGMANLKLEDETVLQHVVRSDRVRERMLREAELLSAAVDNTRDPTAAVRAYRKVSHERLERTTEEVRRIAERRSGARGRRVREEQVVLEEKLERSKARLEEDLATIDPEEISTETQGAADILADLQSSLELMHASAAEAKARTVLLGLGFPVETIDKPMSRLSGGWQTRCEIASALCQSADLLLLDEPTNFLDLPSIIWLQDYIQNLEGTTVVVVTHDRDFADAVAEELILLRNLVLEKFRGNLSYYESEKRKNIRYLTKMKEAQDRQKQHMEQTIQQNIKAAKRTGDDKKLKQAVSRKKKVDDRMGLEVSAKGGRFKLNRDLAGYYLKGREDIDIPKFDPPVKLALPTQPPDLRFPGALISLEKLTFSYSKTTNPILKDVDLTIHPGERVGIAGLNGSGKTTLVSIITGDLAPAKGTVTRHPRVRVGRFSQQAVEELDAIASQDQSLTALKHLMETAGGEIAEQAARGVLGSLGLQGQVVSNVPISALSGGQKVRLALAKVVWSPPHLLILDEVTTHLDADTILALASALRSYEGGLLVITHDRFFMRCVVEGESPYLMARGDNSDEELSDEDEEEEESIARPGVVYRLIKGQLRKLDGGMQKYEEIAARASAKLTKAAVA